MGSEARTVSHSNVVAVAEWCRGKVVEEHDGLDHSVINPAINVLTEEGVKRAYIGDTLIKNSNGTFQIWKGN